MFCLSVMCVDCVYACSCTGQKKALDPLEQELTGGCEPPCEYWELNPHPLQEQQCSYPPTPRYMSSQDPSFLSIWMYLASWDMRRELGLLYSWQFLCHVLSAPIQLACRLSAWTAGPSTSVSRAGATGMCLERMSDTVLPERTSPLYGIFLYSLTLELKALHKLLLYFAHYFFIWFVIWIYLENIKSYQAVYVFEHNR